MTAVQRPARFPSRENIIRALVAAAVVCACLAIGLGGAAHTLRSNPVARNEALVDTASTGAASKQVGDAVRTAFSYDHADPAATRTGAQDVLTGNAVQQYNELFEQVERVAPEQRLTFSTTVRAIGVQRLTGDRARLLVFVDQQGIRADTADRRSGSAQLGVSARHIDGQWKVSEIDVL